MTTPLFPEFKPLELADRAVVQGHFDRVEFPVCEYSFGNNFIWRQYEKARWTILHGNLCLVFDCPGRPTYALAPVGGTNIPETVRTLLDIVPRLARVPASFVEAYGGEFSCEPERDEFDYVYSVEDLAGLAGKKFDGKRNRIRKFEREHEWRYLALDNGHLDVGRKLFEEWFAERDDDSETARGQKAAIQEALAHFEELGFFGGGIEVDGRFAALSIGERLTRDTAVIHIEIVSPCCEGLAQIMNREFARNTLREFAFVNREQDMGLPGLRRAKLSYYPRRLVEKHRLERTS
ncbi:MAG: DUF2156 domain-containing protein [Candidatus Aminicenantes bacterium]|nr:DUF2156 domain-containing protein [Candidatus Aminicenantes bacterium]